MSGLCRIQTEICFQWSIILCKLWIKNRQHERILIWHLVCLQGPMVCIDPPWEDQHLQWHHGKPPPPSSPQKIGLLLNIIISFTFGLKSGPQGVHIFAFPRLNTATKRPHSRRWRYECKGWFTLAYSNQYPAG